MTMLRTFLVLMLIGSNTFSLPAREPPSPKKGDCLEVCRAEHRRSPRMKRNQMRDYMHDKIDNYVYGKDPDKYMSIRVYSKRIQTEAEKDKYCVGKEFHSADCGRAEFTNLFNRPDAKVKIFIPEYELPTRDIMIDGFEYMRRKYVEGGYDLIVVDWYNFAELVGISIPPLFAVMVGNYTANCLDALVRHTVLTPSKIHIIGHGTGAHIAGVASSAMKSGCVERISALDPTGEIYKSSYNDLALESSEAISMDAIHSDPVQRGNPYGTGVPHVIADFDFFVEKDPYNVMSALDFYQTMKPGWLHDVAYWYWGRSIQANLTVPYVCEATHWKWKNHVCDDWQKNLIIGEHRSEYSRGVYYGSPSNISRVPQSACVEDLTQPWYVFLDRGVSGRTFPTAACILKCALQTV